MQKEIKDVLVKVSDQILDMLRKGNVDAEMLRQFNFTRNDIVKLVESEPVSYSKEDMRAMYDLSCGLVGLGELDDQTENNARFQKIIESIKSK